MCLLCHRSWSAPTPPPFPSPPARLCKGLSACVVAACVIRVLIISRLLSIIPLPWGGHWAWAAWQGWLQATASIPPSPQTHTHTRNKSAQLTSQLPVALGRNSTGGIQNDGDGFLFEVKHPVSCSARIVVMEGFSSIGGEGRPDKE